MHRIAVLLIIALLLAPAQVRASPVLDVLYPEHPVYFPIVSAAPAPECIVAYTDTSEAPPGRSFGYFAAETTYGRWICSMTVIDDTGEHTYSNLSDGDEYYRLQWTAPARVMIEQLCSTCPEPAAVRYNIGWPAE